MSSQARAWERDYGGLTSYELPNSIPERREGQFPLSQGNAGCPSLN
jgi:hypothetical protein